MVETSGDPEDTVGAQSKEKGLAAAVCVCWEGRGLSVVTLSNVCAGSLSLLL